jgi:hypothetical protein
MFRLSRGVRLGSKKVPNSGFDLLEAASRSDGGSSRIECDTHDNATVLASLRGQGPSSKRETWQRYGQAARLSTPCGRGKPSARGSGMALVAAPSKARKVG